jgi:predicted transcriptional regulator
MLQMEEQPRQKLCTLPLSYNQLNEYLSIMIENNLIEYLDGTKTFKTTEKGLNLLKIHNEMAELLQTTFKNN